MKQSAIIGPMEASYIDNGLTQEDLMHFQADIFPAFDNVSKQLLDAVGELVRL